MCADQSMQALVLRGLWLSHNAEVGSVPDKPGGAETTLESSSPVRAPLHMHAELVHISLCRTLSCGGLSYIAGVWALKELLRVKLGLYRQQQHRTRNLKMQCGCGLSMCASATAGP